MTDTNTLEESPNNSHDWLLIALLFALVLPLRLWLIHNTEVTARDSIGYVRYALQFEKQGWKEALTSNHQHPGYPLLVCLVSVPVRAIEGATTPENMALCTQLVNLVASLVLLVPMYWLGRQFFDRVVSFFGALLFQYLPVSGQHLSDGISEPVYLLLTVTALLHMVQALRDRTIAQGALCGLFTGLAYLTRPEGALVIGAFAIVLTTMQIVPSWRCPWQHFLTCGAAAALSAAAVGSIYVLTTGQLTNKPAAREMSGMTTAAEQRDQPPQQLFAATVPKTGPEGLWLVRCAWAIGAELNQGLHYFASIPAVLGLFIWFPTLRQQPGFWGLLAYQGIVAAILMRLAMIAGYVSDRHVMILVLLACYLAVAGVWETSKLILQRVRSNDAAPDDVAAATPWLLSTSLWFGVMFAIVVAIGLPKTTQRLHGNRAGNHAAGLWLADHLKTGDHVEDDHAWSHFFSGLLLLEGAEPVVPAGVTPTCYVVTTRSRDPIIDASRQDGVLGSEAKVVYTWPENVAVESARVVVYAQPRDRKKHPWRLASP